MFPYRVKHNESESDIQNNDLLYKTHQKYQNIFEQMEHFKVSKMFWNVWSILYNKSLF